MVELGASELKLKLDMKKELKEGEREERNSKQYNEGWLAYFTQEPGEWPDNPYLNPAWASAWDEGYFRARRLNEGR